LFTILGPFGIRSPEKADDNTMAAESSENPNTNSDKEISETEWMVSLKVTT